VSRFDSPIPGELPANRKLPAKAIRIHLNRNWLRFSLNERLGLGCHHCLRKYLRTCITITTIRTQGMPNYSSPFRLFARLPTPGTRVREE